MTESTLWIIFIIISGSSGQQQCTTDNPVAFMCQNSNVTGSNVTLDVSMAAAIDTDSCACVIAAEVNGMSMIIEKYPDDASNCGSQISVFFLDKSLLTQCGPPPGPQETKGKSAEVVYTRITNSTDSSYCITFFSATQDFLIRLNCSSPATSSQETTTAAITASTLPSNSSSGALSSVSSTLSINASVSSPTATLPTNVSTSSLPLSPNSTLETTRSSFTSISTMSHTLLTTTFRSSSSFNLNTTVITQTTPSVSSTTSASSNSSNMTSISTTLTQSSTVSANVSAASSISPLNNKTATTLSFPLTTMSSSNSSIPSLETTTIKQNITMSSNISITPPTSQPDNRSTTMDSSASSTTEMPTTTTDLLSTTTEYITATDDAYNTVTTVAVKNATASTSTNSSSSAGSTPTTSNSSLNSTVAPDTRTNTQSTTEFNTATTTTDSTYTTNDGTTTTDVTNEPDNVTAEYNTTARPTKTTRNWDWDIPDPGDYSDDNKTNAMVIVLPLVAVILVFFLGAVTFVICKRSRKASRQTRLPKNNEKTVSKDRDKTSPPTFLAPSLVNDQNKKEYSSNTGESIGNGKLNHNKYPTDSAEEGENLQSNTADKSDTMPIATRDKPGVYQPTEKERSLLESLELSTIVVESDPNDPNRYFKKADPGDWYRVVMKGRDPKGKKDKKKKKSRGDEANKHANNGRGKKKHKHSSGEPSDEKKRSRHKSDDTHISEVARNKDHKIEDSLNAIQTVQPRVIVSQPAAKPLTNHEDLSEPKTKVIMSKPSPALGEHRDIRTRTVLSKPSSETTPSANARLSSGQVVIPKATNNINSDQANIHSMSKEAPKLELKRPDIVPPLNLTGTGDKVTRMDDGFDSFVLIN